MIPIVAFLLLLFFRVSLSFHLIARKSYSCHRALSMRLLENVDAVLFDCDGVIAETERDAHRVTFNQV